MIQITFHVVRIIENIICSVNEYMFVGTKENLDILTFVLILKFSLYSLCDGLYEPLLQATSNEEIVNTIPSQSCSLNLQINVLRIDAPIRSPQITKIKTLYFKHKNTKKQKQKRYEKSTFRSIRTNSIENGSFLFLQS